MLCFQYASFQEQNFVVGSSPEVCLPMKSASSWACNRADTLMDFIRHSVGSLPSLISSQPATGSWQSFTTPDTDSSTNTCSGNATPRLSLSFDSPNSEMPVDNEIAGRLALITGGLADRSRYHTLCADQIQQVAALERHVLETCSRTEHLWR